MQSVALETWERRQHRTSFLRHKKLHLVGTIGRYEDRFTFSLSNDIGLDLVSCAERCYMVLVKVDPLPMDWITVPRVSQAVLKDVIHKERRGPGRPYGPQGITGYTVREVSYMESDIVRARHILVKERGPRMSARYQARVSKVHLRTYGLLIRS